MFPRIALTAAIAAAILIVMDFCALRFKRSAAAGPGPRWWEKLAYLVTFLAFAVLVATGFLPTIESQSGMHRWILLAHCSAAPVFAIGMAVIALVWSDYARFGRQASPFDRAQKTVFWLAATCALAVIVSALGGFMPWFGAAGQGTLLCVHRYSALALAVSMVGQAYLFTLGRPGRPASVARGVFAQT